MASCFLCFSVLASLWCTGFSRCREWAPEHAGSVAEAHRRLELQHVGFSCSQARGILALQPAIEPTSPVSEGRFSTTESPEKSPWPAFNLCFLS